MRPRVRHAEIAAYVAGQILYWRNARKLTQTQLAKKVGVAYQQIQKYETGGSRITVDSIGEIARALEVPISSFFPYHEPKQETYDAFDQQLQMLKDEAGVLENIASALQSTIERLK